MLIALSGFELTGIILISAGAGAGAAIVVNKQLEAKKKDTKDKK
jgi:hypothetical protein